MVVMSSLGDDGRGRLLTGTKLYLNTGNKLCNSDSILCIPQNNPNCKGVSGILKTGKMRGSLLLPSAVGARQFNCVIGFYFLIVSDFLLFLFL